MTATPFDVFRAQRQHADYVYYSDSWLQPNPYTLLRRRLLNAIRSLARATGDPRIVYIAMRMGRDDTYVEEAADILCVWESLADDGPEKFLKRLCGFADAKEWCSSFLTEWQLAQDAGAIPQDADPVKIFEAGENGWPSFRGAVRSDGYNVSSTTGMSDYIRQIEITEYRR